MNNELEKRVFEITYIQCNPLNNPFSKWNYQSILKGHEVSGDWYDHKAYYGSGITAEESVRKALDSFVSDKDLNGEFEIRVGWDINDPKKKLFKKLIVQTIEEKLSLSDSKADSNQSKYP